MRVPRLLLVGLLAVVALGGSAGAQSLAFSLFERYLESLRQQAGIPGLSAAIVQDGRIVWERGFGVQDVERAVAATPDTPYPIAALTQTFASVLLMQCVERGTLSLDDPILKWTSLIPESGATIRHLLTHASEGAPGAGFKYDPSRYAALTPVSDACGDQPYRRLLAQAILDRLGMADSVPGHDLGDPSAAAPRELFDQETLARYAAVLRRLATPYRVDKRGKSVRSEYPPGGINASVGLISTVRDLARYDAALDDRVLLRADTLGLAWTNAVSGSGAALPTGLGWFVQPYTGERIVWHFGVWPDAFSSLVVKVPGRGLTLILLANSDGLSASFPLAEGDVTTSLFARLFLRLFV